MRLIFCLACLIATAVVTASELSLHFNQTFIQGALITGETSALRMQVNERDVPVDAQGRFVFGLGRDTSSPLRVTLYGAHGETQHQNVVVQQREYPTQRIHGVEQKYVSPPAEILSRTRSEAQKVALARQTNRTNAYEYIEPSIWPAEGPVTGVYGSQRVFNDVPKRPHYGLDIAGPVGQSVYAPLSGEVTLAEPDLYYSGGTLIVDHGRGVSSTFIHLNRLHVQVGDYVQQGQHIADIGATGRVTGPHLDWRLNWFEIRLDPALILPDRDNLHSPTTPKR